MKFPVNINYITIGFIFVIIGFAIIFLGSLFNSIKGNTDTNSKFSFVGFIGPIPIGFSNDKQLLIFSIIIAAIIFVLTILFYYRGGN
jgi:uncharacterized protein (TIGR00304 family)